MNEPAAVGIMVVKCQNGFTISTEANPAQSQLYVARTIEEVAGVLSDLFKLEIKGGEEK